MFGFLKRRRRERIRREPFPLAWIATLRRNVPYYARLSETDQATLRGHIQVFLAEKHFEGCGGLELTDEIRITVAAYACILLLRLDGDYYPGLVTILVYPGAFVVETRDHDGEFLVAEDEEVRAGEAWHRGVVVLAWDDVREGFVHPHDGQNVVLHEFAHILDMENGDAEGFPFGMAPDLRARWTRVLSAEYDRLLDDLDRRRPTVIDEYAATDPAEFFAVVTECFFETPERLKRERPDLYDAFRDYYRQDPASDSP